jgi:hypothetical protein
MLYSLFAYYFFNFLNSPTMLFINTTTKTIIQKTIIFHILSKNKAVIQKKKESEYIKVSICLFVNHLSSNL